jgi:glycosyltransferase involved in cell wall biosynthesis
VPAASRVARNLRMHIPSRPSISVITVCKNAAPTIERTLASIAQCRYPNLERVVVDGGSTDGTLEILDRYRERVDKLVSEPDEGISDALNKAIALSSGEYHIIVHADDVIRSEALEMLSAAAGADRGAQVICGRVAVIDKGRLVRMFVPDPNKLTQKMSVPHMGALIRKQAWSAVGGYDLRRRIAMDHLLMLQILRRFGISAFRTVDVLVANYSLGGLSDRQIVNGFRELRANLLEEGCGRLAANTAYLTLLVKSRIARAVRAG